MILSDARRLFTRLEEDLGLVSEINVPFLKKMPFFAPLSSHQMFHPFSSSSPQKKLALMATLPSQARPPSD